MVVEYVLTWESQIVAKRGKGACYRLFSKYYWFNHRKKKTIAIRQIIFLHLQLLLDLCPSSLWFVFINFQQNSYVFIFGNLYTLEFLTAHASRIVFVPRSNKFENRTVWNVYIQYNNYQPIFQYFKINWFNPGIHIGI